MSQPIKTLDASQGGHLGFPIGQKYTNFVGLDVVEIMHAICNVSLNSVKRLQRRSRKCVNR